MAADGPAGPVAGDMAELGWQMTWLGIGVFVLVVLLLIVGLVRKPEDNVDRTVMMKRWLVGGGVVLPVLIITVVFVLTLFSMRATSLEAPHGAVSIHVTGHQFWWEVSYPGEDLVTANEVHLPVDQPIEFVLTSADVIHSFWIPELGGKIDMLPEDINTYVLESDTTGVFDGACAEFCGLQHARMRFVAVAETENDYRSWIENEASDASQPEGEAASRGQEVFLSAGCADCHTVRGTDADGTDGPDLTHIASRRTLAAGTLDNTTENLRDWIENPHRFKDGVEMPASELSDQDLDDLVAYLEGLE